MSVSLISAAGKRSVSRLHLLCYAFRVCRSHSAGSYPSDGMQDAVRNPSLLTNYLKERST